MRYFYKTLAEAAYMAKHHNFQFETEGGRKLEFYTYNDTFRYAHPTLDEWIYPEGKFYITSPLNQPEKEDA